MTSQKKLSSLHQHDPPLLSTSRNLLNLGVMIAAAVPILWEGWFALFSGRCNEYVAHDSGFPLRWKISNEWGSISFDLESLCVIAMQRPLTFINLAFMANVCVTFWLISLPQRSTWLIDPYWTFVPPLIGAFCVLHPSVTGNRQRLYIMYTLVLIWSVRLTHSYFRRERWQCGWREDWRFADKRQALGPVAWTPVSFFYAYVAQQPMLVGLCLPLVAAAFAPVAAAPPGATEAVLSMLCILGISFACIADNQLYRFMEENKRRLETGQPKVLLLETGLWKFSRHPNYFGEQLWWWSLAGFAWNVGQSWALVGPFFNTLVMAAVTGLTEARMLRDPRRADLYRAYQRRTSVWVPLPRRGRAAAGAAAAEARKKGE